MDGHMFGGLASHRSYFPQGIGRVSGGSAVINGAVETGGWSFHADHGSEASSACSDSDSTGAVHVEQE
jgi:hypothetical protein